MNVYTFFSKLLAFGFVLGFFACDDDNDTKPDITAQLSTDLEENELFFEADGGENSFYVYSNTEWSIDYNDALWLDVSPISGKDTTQVNVIADNNEDEKQRTQEITISTTDADNIKLTVIQAGKPFFNYTDDTEIEIDSYGGEILLSFESNVNWSIEYNNDWIHFSEETGFGDGELVVYIEPNYNSDTRDISFELASVETDNIQFNVEQGVYDKKIEPDNSDMRDLTALQYVDLMEVGWNLGNSLEAIIVSGAMYTGGETSWGNPPTSKRLIDSIKAAGFDAIRIPVSWSHKLEDQDNYIISEEWLSRVEQVVNYALDNDMYTKINIHWDGGWMNQPFYEKQHSINHKLAVLWTQIAVHFRDYDDRLIFAGTNEVHVDGDWGWPSTENLNVQNSFNQSFVDAVRATGGRNHYRQLVVQGYNTNIDQTISGFNIPEDVINDRMIVEIHYYDPYNFALNENIEQASTQWGEIFENGDVCDEGQEDHVDTQFSRLRNHFITGKGIPVLLGEYGAIHRTELEGEEYEKHVQARNYYLEYVTKTAVQNGIVPYYWDNGYDGNNGFALFDRDNGEVIDPDALEAIMEGAK